MPKIIHIRGTSGSGKTHLARRVFALYSREDEVFKEGRKQPIYSVHTLVHPNGVSARDKFLRAIGHYKTDCGGADTVSSMDEIHDLVADGYSRGEDVLFEGLLSTPEYNRTISLQQVAGTDLHVIFLTTPLDECVASVNARRAAKAARTGKPAPPPLNPKNTESKYRSCAGAARKLRQAGVQVHELDRDAAFKKICEILGLGS